MKRTAPVLVACSQTWSSPARLPRVLARAGCRVSVLCPPGAPLASTRFADERIAAPAELPAYVDALAEHLERAGDRYRWLLITDDPLLDALARRRAEPWIAARLPIDGRSRFAALLASKADFTDAAAAAGLPIPASRVCASLSGARAAAAEIGFPVMLKKSLSFAGLGVRAAADDAELARAFLELDDGAPLVLQRFHQGRIGNSVVLFQEGRPICWMSAYKSRTWPGPFGPSSARQFMSHADVEPILAAFGALTGYHGFGAVDWVCDAVTGRLVILEFNARPVPTIHMSRLAGVDFSSSIAAMLAGRAEVQRPPERAPGPIVRMFPEDVYRAATEKQPLELAGLLPWPGRYSDVPWSDPPLLAWHLRAFRRAAREQKRAA
ncbi:MAG TPA: hypothetical protein VFF06_10450 [Polyangia bacterium]|nr:hypothetical protein [Polyangia bacterium]